MTEDAGVTGISDLYAYFTTCLIVLLSLEGWEIHEHGGRRRASGQVHRRARLMHSSAREPHQFHIWQLRLTPVRGLQCSASAIAPLTVSRGAPQVHWLDARVRCEEAILATEYTGMQCITVLLVSESDGRPARRVAQASTASPQ